MKVGDRVKFRRGSKAWAQYGLEAEASGLVAEVYRDPEDRSSHKVDVNFDGMSKLARGVDCEELAVVA